MHPVKAEEASEEAYFTHGVPTFSLDTMDELEKIVRATKGASDLNLCVRIRVSSEHAKLSLASKFGAEPEEMKALLIATRQAADALGICFHVGSQAMTPAAYHEALERVRAALRPLIRRHRDETIGLVVAEPIAQLIAGYLRRDPHVQLDDDVPTGGFERIEVAPECGRNGDH